MFFYFRKYVQVSVVLSMYWLAGVAAPADGSLAQPYTVNDCESFSLCPFGVYRFSVKDDVKKIQTTLDAIYVSISGNPEATATYSPKAEWSEKRFALLFDPGSYDVDVKLNYYTQLLGLGSSPEQVNLTNIVVDSLCFAGNIQSCLSLGALNNFWRGVENVTFNPRTCRIPPDGKEFKNDKCIIWNVSQASPMRQVIVNGDLMLNLAGCFNHQGQCNGPKGSGGDKPCPGEYNKDFSCGAGYASGGFLAKTKVLGSIHSIAQQQWFTRNSSFDKWIGGVWNMVFLNNTGEVPTTSPANPQYVNLQDPKDWSIFAITDEHNNELVMHEKPYLVDENHQLKVLIPGTARSYPLETLVVMNKNNQDVSKINAELSQKNGLVIEPGRYQLSSAIHVPAGKFVLGLGMAELQCIAGNSCLEVSGSHAIVAGVMLAAGYQQSETLLNVSRQLGNANSNEQSTYLFDIFCRVGESSTVRQGSGPTTKNCVTINADYVVGDNLWLWRADHDLASGQSSNPVDNLVKWDQDVTQHGLVVNGDNVTMLGLFSEHHQASNVLWNGNEGKTYFYQSELAYDAPKDWQCADLPIGMMVGCPSYTVGENVTSHTGYGLSAYTYFQQDVMISTGFLAPLNDRILLKHLVGRYLNATPNPVTQSGMSCLVKDYSVGNKTCYGPSATQGMDNSVDSPARLPALGQWPESK